MSYSKYNDTVGAPARECFTITPHATNPLTTTTKAIRAPSDGIIVLKAIDSVADVSHPVLQGEVIAVRATHVRSTTCVGTLIGYA